MGHLITRDAYRNLGDHINWLTQGASASEILYKILQVLYSEKEVKWVALLSVHPFTIKKAAKIRGTPEYKAEKLLDHLCGKALLVDSWDRGVWKFTMLLSMAGFIESTLMRIREDVDQKYLSKLYYQYMNVEGDFIKGLFYATETKLGRVSVQEPALINDRMNHILDYERAAHIVEETEYIGLGFCYCRHKMFHAGHPCEISVPWGVCLIFDNVVRSLAQHGDCCKLISKEETMDALKRPYASNLVQIGEDMWKHPILVCSYCGCYYEALQAARRFSPTQPVATTNYISDTSGDQYVGCGKCAKVCPILAIPMEDGGNGKKHAAVDKDICFGYGVCARNCGVKAIHMERRPRQIITPTNSTHRFALQAIEKGTLADLVFDNQAFSNHRVMAALFSVILELPPLKQAMASKQFKSVYLDRLLVVKRGKG